MKTKFGQRLRQLVMPIIITIFFVVLLVLSSTFAGLTERYVQQNLQNVFVLETQNITDRINERLEIYHHTLRASRALFDASDHVSRTEWANFTASIDLQDRYPGIRGLGFSKYVLADQVAAHEAELHADGFPEAKLYPASNLSEHMVATYVEPFSQFSPTVLGFDAYSDAVRKATMQRAIVRNNIAVSPKVNLISDVTPQPSFVMYIPVYQHNLPTNTINERRVALYGFITASFRMQELMNGILGDSSIPVNFTIYDGEEEQTTDTLMYDSSAQNGSESDGRFTLTRIVDVYGHPWTVQFTSTEVLQLSKLEQNIPMIMSLVGIGLSILTFLLLINISTARQRAEQYATKLTNDLRQSVDQLQQQAIDARIKAEETERLNKLMVNRELKMIELKEQLAKLKKS